MKKKLISIFLTIIFVFSFGACGEKASNFTEEEHMARIAKRVEARYFSEGSGYDFTDYEVHPVYDENDELKYAVVDFAPSGFVFIKIREEIPFYATFIKDYSLYTRDVREGALWRRYVLKDKTHAVLNEENIIYETNQDGEPIEYSNSPYKIAEIKAEKYYLLYTQQPGGYNYIPAVKRENFYLNLVSMAEMNYEKESATLEYEALDLYFINQKGRWL